MVGVRVLGPRAAPRGKQLAVSSVLEEAVCEGKQLPVSAVLEETARGSRLQVSGKGGCERLQVYGRSVERQW